MDNDNPTMSEERLAALLFDAKTAIAARSTAQALRDTGFTRAEMINTALHMLFGSVTADIGLTEADAMKVAAFCGARGDSAIAMEQERAAVLAFAREQITAVIHASKTMPAMTRGPERPQ